MVRLAFGSAVLSSAGIVLNQVRGVWDNVGMHARVCAHEMCSTADKFVPLLFDIWEGLVFGIDT